MIKRLPVIRHIRWLYLSWQVERHYEGMLPTWRSLGNRQIDDAVLDAIWRGER